MYLADEPEGILVTVKLDVLSIYVLEDENQISQESTLRHFSWIQEIEQLVSLSLSPFCS